MNRKLLAAGLLLVASPLVAQSSFELPLVSGTVVYQYKANAWEGAAPESNEIVNGRYYRHVRFAVFPGPAERQQLEAAGLRVLEYVAAHTYVVSIDAAVTSLTGFGIEGVYPITGRAKQLFELRVAIAGQDFPAFARNENGHIGISFTYYRDMPQQEVLTRLAAAGYKVTYANANSRRVIAWMPASAIEAFCNLPFVAAAELKDDVPQPDNNVGRTNHRNNMVAQDFAGGLGYTGAGVNVMLQDDGIIGPHVDYTGRLMQQYITFNGGDHGDHCAGIIMGGGNKDPLTRGMGWGANLYVYEAAPYQGFDSIYNHYNSNGIVITSTSYSDGCNAGYTTLAQTLDQQIVDMPSLIHVFSAGNTGTSDCGYGAGTGWGNVTGGHKHSKNSIAVGNLTYMDVIANSSSRGPVHDGRMKPEVCAVGTNVYSTIDTDDYGFKTGTSMSCPGVSGTFSQLYHAYKDLNGNVNPPSGLMKGVLMNTADDLGNAGPDFIYGYGRINARKAVKTIQQQQYVSGSVGNSGSNTHTINVPSSTGRLKVLVYWHDIPAAVNASVALVNDLDMTMSDPSNTSWQPWVLNFTPPASNLSAAATRGTDVRNNHEQITIDNPASGNYTVTIAGTAVPSGPQTYYLVWYFEPADELMLTYPNGGEGFVPGETETIRWDALGNTGTFDLDYTTDNGNTWQPVTTGISASLRYYDWLIPASIPVSGQCKLRITRNSASDMSDARFSFHNVPSNITVVWSCPDSLLLRWNGVAGATGYDVMQLGTMYMDSVTSSTADSAVVRNLDNINNGYWFSVRARGAQNAVGRRAIAIEKLAGIACPGTFDAELTTVSSPGTSFASCMNVTNLPVSITLTNPGITTLTNIPVGFRLNNGPVVNETYSGTLAPSATANYTFTATVSITNTGMNTLEVWAAYPSDINVLNDTQVLAINYGSVATITPPWAENFESFALCSSASDCEQTNCPLGNGLVNTTNGNGDDIDWRVFEGATPSTSTGPSFDFLPGTATGNYIYLEPSGGCTFKTAEMLTPCFDLTNAVNPSLTFGYHMQGTNMGELHVDIYANGAWTNDIFVRTGNQASTWQTALVPLTSYVGQTVLFRFRGITGNDFASDLALDGIEVTNSVNVTEPLSAQNVQVFPNPGNGQYQVQISGAASEYTLEVFDLSGRMLLQQTTPAAAGQLNTSIDLSMYAAGTYMLRISTGSASEFVKLEKID
jgi:subtilisin family serine protease